ncbi:hypothetical protein ABB07_07130 [Streptomyces incarnatus]|uniref:Uncharacterized protein n=1 Tax=Streptomyces incarnatus TaxID=665007 RepID=A0ABM5TFN5_9ACTN|nr:hypothetical protein [Streptomyces incarnatus]AKJ09799.1 hypothetical protein ABB07_07130 [Streptomyces incarnatus]
MDWLVDPTAPQGLTFPLALSAVLAANVPLTLAGPRLKRTLVGPLHRYLINPPVRLLLRLGIMPLGYALLETEPFMPSQPGRGSGPGRSAILHRTAGRAAWERSVRADRGDFLPCRAALAAAGRLSGRGARTVDEGRAPDPS